jgi:magnesium transporter
MADALLEAERELIGGFFRLHPVDSARALEQLDAADAGNVLRDNRRAEGSMVIPRMQPDAAAHAIATMGAEEGALALAALDPAIAANLLARLRHADKEALRAGLPASVRDEIDAVASYPPNTAGALMDPMVTVFVRSTTVEQAIERLRSLSERHIADVVITDDDGRFVGVTRLQSILTADPEQTLGGLMQRDAPSVRPMTLREEVVEIIDKLKLASLPVVDFDDRVVGILRHDALVEATRRDATEDMQRMVGASEEERALSEPAVAVKSRLPWLYINLLTAFLASAVVGIFEETIATFTAAAVLLPVVAGQSGNTGAQSLAVTMRGLALREVRTSQAFRLLRKEAWVGFLNGLAIAGVTAACVFLYAGPGFALVMFLAMTVAMVIASMSGAAIPVLLTLAKRDPATASSILLTTVTDVFGFLVFLGLVASLAPLLGGG